MPPQWQFIGIANSDEGVIAAGRQSEPDRCLYGAAVRDAPADDRREVVPLLPARECLSRAQTAVGLDADDEILGADAAGRAARQSSKMTRHADAVPELEPFAF